MEIKDLILTPFYLIIIYFVAIIIRNNTLKDSPLKKYFIPALTVKIIGSIAVGLVYHFYYGGGDTFFFYQGTTIIWEAFLENPVGFRVQITLLGAWGSNFGSLSGANVWLRTIRTALIRPSCIEMVISPDIRCRVNAAMSCPEFRRNLPNSEAGTVTPQI